jgi:hypothetical protein
MTLTPEQHQALNELFAHVPKPENGNGTSPSADWLQTWFGVSGADLKAQLQGWLGKKDIFEQQLLDVAKRNPLDSAFGFLLAASAAFYAAEKDTNPRIKTYIDAFYYISTCASVGYADIFAATQPGRAIASLVMIVGPALTNAAFDRPVRLASETPEC